jgi:SAM-dependent methyltransferase
VTQTAGEGSSDSAAERWASALDEWAIPDHILASVQESPWSLAPWIFRRRVEEFGDADTPSRRRALEVLPDGGTVLDVGVGAGAASLPLIHRAGLIIGVDENQKMLEAFVEEATRRKIAHQEILGRWPDISTAAPTADVVVCHHVFYNARDLPRFVRALSHHAGRRVVAEITESHPMSMHNDLWLKFHGIRRPTRPTAADAVALIQEAGFDPRVELWVRPRVSRFKTRPDLVSFVRGKICLDPSREPEIDELLGEDPDITPRGVATLWWNPNG